ncbi:uncharacterized protein LOC131881575 [Tigriopus californicus]|uniref:uncharacterized protein LOC131881575 n=1 Tax=Tigriopus californicus TaxID=6832 RepID=UPI0027D9F5F7|nr:uncharacterized protein LOC131881575 [Tigriopus californicus]
MVSGPSIVVWLASVVCIIHGEHNKICDRNGMKCEKVPTGLKGEPLDEFRSWWSKMSEQKPLRTKCVLPSKVPLMPNVKPPILESFACSETDLPIFFEFSGLIDSNHLFQGPGKLTIFGPSKKGQVHKHPGTCIRYRKISFIVPKVIVGFFLFGKPHGLVRVEGQEQGLMIGEVREGCPHGFLRLWRDPDTLAYAYYSFNGDLPVFSWYNVNGTFLYRILRQTPEYIENEEDAKFMAVAIHNGTNVFAGEDLYDFNVIVNASSVKIESWTEENCLLHPHFINVLGSSPFTFHPAQGQVVFESSQKRSWTFCHSCQKSTKNAIREFIAHFNPSSGQMWTMTPDDSEVDPDAPQLISDLKHVNGLNFKCRLLGSKKIVRAQLTFGKIDSLNRILGPFGLSFNPADTPTLAPFDQGIAKICGHLKYGQLSSFIRIHIKDGGYVYSRIKNGVLHGPARALLLTTLLPLDEAYQSPEFLVTESHDIRTIFHYKSGKVQGPVWFMMIGGGFLYGYLDTHGKFTGDQMAFVYPDYETALVGRFEDKVMKAGQEATITGTTCDPNEMLVLQFSEPSGPVLFYSPPTNISFGEGPQAIDPFEAKWAEIRRSNVHGGGEGVFAVRDVPSDQIFCLYSGFIYRNREEKELFAAQYTMNESLSADMRRHGTKYSIIVLYSLAQLQIPWEVDQPESWHPTMGAKINADFPERHQNAVFDGFEHPRFGLIVAVRATKDIRQGQEILVDYGYQEAPFPADFLWYHQAKKEYLQELESKRKEEEKLAMRHA